MAWRNDPASSDSDGGATLLVEREVGEEGDHDSPGRVGHADLRRSETARGEVDRATRPWLIRDVPSPHDEVPPLCDSLGRPLQPFVVYNGHAKWGAATDLADWIVPDPDPVLKRLLGLQMRRRYILVELRDLAPGPSDSPPDNWFSTLAEWENARWGRDAGRLAKLWRTVLESGEEGIIRGFGALRQQLAPGLPEPDPKLTAATPGRRRTMIRHEETLMAARLRKLYEELRQEGREEGRREGLQEGRREARSLLRQLAVQKFGPEVVGELSSLFDQLTDPDRVEALAAAIIECRHGCRVRRAGTGGVVPSSTGAPGNRVSWERSTACNPGTDTTAFIANAARADSPCSDRPK